MRFNKRATSGCRAICFVFCATFLVSKAGLTQAEPPQGQVVGWGELKFGVDLSEGIVKVAAGELHQVGLRADGSVVTWGSNHYRACSVPAPNSGFIDVAAGRYHSVGLKGNGSVVSWGCADSGWDYGQCAGAPSGSGFVAVFAGGLNSAGLKADGSVTVWGNNFHGQRNPPSGPFVTISIGDGQLLGLKANGTIAAWGRNHFGVATVPSPNSGFVAVAAGQNHNLALKADGSIVAWGSNTHGQLSVPTPNTGFTRIAAGSAHSLGIRKDGSVLTWGCAGNDDGQCAVPEPNTGFVAVAAAGRTSVGLLSDDSVKVWGGLANGPDPNQEFTGVAAGFHNIALRNDGTIALGDDVPSPNSEFVEVSVYSGTSLALRQDGSVVAWCAGTNYGQCNQPEPNAGFVSVSAGLFHSLGLTIDGSIRAWGCGSGRDYGQCDSPSLNEGFVAVAAGDKHSLGLKADGSITAWGQTYDSLPYPVPDPNDSFIAIATSGHSLGLRDDGSVVAWGCAPPYNYGQCSVPPPNEGFVAVAAGTRHSLGLKSDGSAVAWGCQNPATNYGQCLIPEPNANFVTIAAGGTQSLAIKRLVNCTFDEECDDRLPCTIDECDPLTNRCARRPMDSLCDDELSCTPDRCQKSTGMCAFVIDDASCDDGLYCNGSEHCSAVDGCLSGLPACDDGFACTMDQCHESTDSCSYVPVIEPCDTLFVAASQQGGDGLSWESALGDLQEALQIATEHPIREIRVAQGTYRPDRGTGDRAASFQLINGVRIKGGFAGPGAPDPDAQDPRVFETTLSGDLAGDDLPPFWFRTENSYHVVTGSGTDRRAALDGFTITSGYSNGSGAGIYINPGSPLIRNCRIVSNATYPFREWPGYAGGPGAGAYCNGPALIKDCIIEGNQVGYGVETAGREGGGLWLSEGATLDGCIVRNNQAGDGGAATCQAGTCHGPWPGGDGGGIYAGSSAIIRNCLITANLTGSGSHGITCGGGLCSTGSSSAGKGGGVYGNPTITNCTIANNFSNNQFAADGVHGAARISNSILWGNGTTPSSQVTSNAVIDHSAIQGWNGGAAEGNIGLNPLFVSGPLGDFYLSQASAGQPVTSPCVDSGNDLAANLGLDERFTRTDGVPDSGVVDMGFHYRVQCLADSDCVQDGSFCNGTEHCQAGACLPSGNPCGADECCDDSLSECVADSPGEEPVLFVAQREGDRVSRLDGLTGAALPTPVPTGSGGLDYANGIALSKYDGSLWIASVMTGSIEKFRPKNDACAFDHIGSSDYGAAMSGLVYGPDDFFYFSDYENDRIYHIRSRPGQGSAFDSLTGCGLDGPTGLAFLNSNTLLVGSEKNDNVIAFNTITGTCSMFAQGCGLDAPVGIAVAADGSVLVASYATDSVIKFGPTGDCLGAFVGAGSCGLDGPQGMAFGPNGNLFVSSLNTDQVLEYSGASGLPIDRNLSLPGVQCQFSQPGQLDGPTYLLWVQITDCDHNGIDDESDVLVGDATDCDENDILDSCEIEQDPAIDANNNQIPDVCEPDPEQTVRFVDVTVCPRAGTGRESDPFCSIQRAIDHAADGHQIVVRPGTYRTSPSFLESINFLGKSIVVRSAEGASQTRIGFCVMNSLETRASVLEGFTTYGISLTNASPTIIGCAITNGQGIDSVGGAPLIRDCLITDNGGTHGGGIHADGPAEIDRCVITNNAAYSGPSGGGPGGNGGGAYLTGGAIIRNSLVALNEAGDGTYDDDWDYWYPSGSGGGIYAGENVQIIGCTIVWNRFGGEYENRGQGNGIYSATATNRVQNCVVYANWHEYANYSGGDVQGAFAAVEHSCITRPLVPGVGNIALPHVESTCPECHLGTVPYFEDFYGPDQHPWTPDDNYRLKPGSPCANAGAPDFAPLPEETDLDGEPRVKCGRVDMGAYESGSDDSPCVTFYDLKGVAGLMACATGTNTGYDDACTPFDFNVDGRINTIDLAIFVQIDTGK